MMERPNIMYNGIVRLMTDDEFAQYQMDMAIVQPVDE